MSKDLGLAPSNSQEHLMPMVVLVPCRFYWINAAYENQDEWIVARWEVGSFWGPNGSEITPSIVCGPIQEPTPIANPETAREHNQDTNNV